MENRRTTAPPAQATATRPEEAATAMTDDGDRGGGHAVDDLAAERPPSAGILSRTLHSGSDVSLVHFAFAAGEELSEHTSSRPAVMHVLSGELDMVVAGERIDGHAGTWVHMPPGTRHALRARVPSAMLLTLLPREA